MFLRTLLLASILPLAASAPTARADPAAAPTTAPTTRPATGCTATVQSAKIDVVQLKPHAATPEPAPPANGDSDLFSGLREDQKPSADQRPTDQTFLIVRLKVTNTGREKCLYHPLDGSDPKCPTMAILHDDARHVYALVNFGGDMDVVGAVRAARTLKPGESVTDVIVFEVPPESAKGLRLIVPKENVGRKERVEPLAIRPDR